MFQNALIESNHAIRSTACGPAAISIAIQAACAAVLLSIPMVHPEVLTPRSITLPLVPPPIRRAPEPPPQRVRLQNTSTSLPSTPTQYQHPIIDTHILPTQASTDGQPVIATLHLGGSDTGPAIPFGVPSGPSGRTITVGGGGPASAPHAEAPTNVSRGIAQGLLLTQIRPEYPHIAVLTRTSGTVTVQAVISKTGTIESARAVSGPDLLRAAAVDAVRQARYRPYLLNGQPTEVEATYTINFTLGS